ncbi:MAG: peptidoglycan DD-metalloendopeptidase family protein [Oscillospiraceae bacterium]|nr:peptidoglycan DD-metalloendopeptidase family protein [Oscillospiraceae bacterium]
MKKYNERKNWKQWIVRLLALALALLMLGSVLLSLPVFGITQSEVDALKKEADAAKKEKDRLAKELEQVKKDKNSTTKQLQLLDQQIKAAEDQIAAQESLVEELGKLVEEKQRELDRSQGDLDAQYERSRQRIRFMAEYGNTSYLQILLSAENFYDFLSRWEVIRQVSVSDQELLDDLRIAKDLVKQQSDSLAASLTEAENTKASLAANQTSLENQRTEKNDLLSRLSDEQSETYSEYVAAIDAAEKQMQEYMDAAAELSAQNAYVGGKFMWPLPAANTVVTSKYGSRTHPVTGKKESFHTGIDLRASKGTKIYAAQAGEVITSAEHYIWGNYVIISHGGGYTSLYAHMTKRNVKVGDKVKVGQTIGTVGSTGWSTAAHLHFELQKNGNHFNPLTEYPNVKVTYK